MMTLAGTPAQRVSFAIAAAVACYTVVVSAATPTVSDAQPNVGSTAGGTMVTLSGTGFSTATAVTFGGTAATFEIQSDIRILARAPASPEGQIDIRVTNADGTGTLQGGFRYLRIPTSGDDAYTTPFNTPLEVTGVGVLSNDNTNDGGSMSVAVDANVTHGTLTLNADGSFIYTPTAGFIGTDQFTYRATNNLGTGASATVTITVAQPTSAQAPTNLFVSAVSGNSVTLRWTPPLLGITPTGYIIEAGVLPGGVAGTIATGSTVPFFTFTAPTGALYFRVRATASTGTSEPSNEIRVFVNLSVVPSAPADLAGVVNGSNLSLSWRNTLEGGQPTGLVLDVTGSITTSIPLALTDNFSFAGVPNGTYTLALRATNAAGSSSQSAPLTLTFPSVCSGAPPTPINFLAVKSGSTITVLWDPATTGPASTSYVLSVTGSFTGTFPTTGRMISGTVSAGSYTFTVIALNACGVSAPTAPQTLTIP